MCEICGHFTCVSGCPNREEKAVYTCKYCGEAIVEGEECYEYDGDYYHEDCFSDCAVYLLLESGAIRLTAEEEVPDYDPYDD